MLLINGNKRIYDGLETETRKYHPSSSYRCGFEPSLVTCETSHVQLGDGHVFFLGDLPFLPHLTIDSAQNEWNNLDGPFNTQKKKEILGKFSDYLVSFEAMPNMRLIIWNEPKISLRVYAVYCFFGIFLTLLLYGKKTQEKF